MALSESKPKRPYIDVNLPRNWKQYLDEALANTKIRNQLEVGNFSKTHSGLGKWIIREFLLDNTSFRFKHINTNDRHITIQDNKTRRVFDVRIEEEPNQLRCGFCDRTDCEHVAYAYTLPEVRKTLKKKGWELPEVT